MPFQITSNPFIARQYAQIAIEALKFGQRDFLELGGGSGKFAYLFLKELLPRVEALNLPPIRYYLTDISEKNRTFWESHPLLKPLIAQGVLKTTFYDPLEGPPPFALLEDSFVIANYFFDTVTQDLFRMKNGNLFQGHVSLQSAIELDKNDPAIINHLEESYSFLPTGQKPHFAELENGTYLHPVGALQTLSHLPGNFILLMGDKGPTTLSEFEEWDHPKLDRHGAFSFPVNFPSIGQYIKKRGGKMLLPKKPARDFVVSLVYSQSEIPAVSLAYRDLIDSFDPQDAFDLMHSLKNPSRTQFLKVLKLTNWDPSLFILFSEQVEDFEGVKEDFLLSKKSFFPLSQEEAFVFDLISSS